MYLNNETFWCSGVERIKPSDYNAQRNCPICLEPLLLLPFEVEKQAKDVFSTLHDAVRINACSHVHGFHCLQEWLKVGHTCPTCSRILFTPRLEQPLSEEEIRELMGRLAPHVGADNASWIISQRVRRVERDSLAKTEERERALEREREREEAISEDEWYDDEDEETCDEDDGDADYQETDGSGDDEDDEDEDDVADDRSDGEEDAQLADIMDDKSEK